MRREILTLFAALFFGGVCSAQTPMDIQPVKQLTRGNSLASCGYTPTEKEKPFFDKLAPEEQVTGSRTSRRSLSGFRDGRDNS